MSDIKYYTIYGERCSGTKYLEDLFNNNFNIELKWDYGCKHFFGFHKFNIDLSDNDSKNYNEDQTLFICVVRNPVDWLTNFYESKYNLPLENYDIDSFLKNEFYSVYDINDNSTIIKEDLNYLTGEKYKNIFEMRYLKNHYLVDIMPTKVKNYIILKYEDIKNNTFNILNYIQSKFDLKLKNNIIISDKNSKSIKNVNSLSIEKLHYINSNLNLEQETVLNYNIYKEVQNKMYIYDINDKINNLIKLTDGLKDIYEKEEKNSLSVEKCQKLYSFQTFLKNSYF